VPRTDGRSFLVLGLAGVALVALLFPPWRARAIRTTTRYAAVAGVTPSTVADTIDWLLPFAPIYAPPRPLLAGARMRELSARATRGDSDARRRLRDSTRDVEQRYHAPEVLRTDGEVWRDSVLTAAGIPAISSYDLAFTIDQRWLAARLAALGLIAFLLRWRSRRRSDTHHQ
jgi:hypothetical protein